MGHKRHLFATVLRYLIPLAVGVCVLVYFSAALNNLNSGQSEESLRQLEDSLRRASVACYAAEGVYPPDLDYLKEHYGLQINEERYTVFYEIFAENLMPAITVLEKES
jgi:hypothetical protein